MFSKLSVVASVLITLAAAIPNGTPPPPVTTPDSPQCCAGVVPASSTAASLVTAVVGLSCSPHHRHWEQLRKHHRHLRRSRGGVGRAHCDQLHPHHALSGMKNISWVTGVLGFPGFWFYFSCPLCIASTLNVVNKTPLLGFF
ncbi:hypothetical protein B0H14DRAFT_3879020, partial [Mycena olivaceomarginata]